jgi:RimJ/RimL family protein N-acetyltransferase
MPTNLQLMELSVATGFQVDADGRLRSVNEPGDEDAPPRFYMGRTSEGNVWSFRYDLPSVLVHELEQLCRTEPLSTDFERPPLNTDAIRAALHAHAPIEAEERGPLFVIPDHLPTPTHAVSITAQNVHVLQQWFPWRAPLPTDFDIGPFTGTIVQGSAVSLCFCSRLAMHGAGAGVETLEPFRGKGYATEAVAAWAIEVRRRGLLPFYSTSWENLASRGIARKLGMMPFGEKWWIA